MKTTSAVRLAARAPLAAALDSGGDSARHPDQLPGRLETDRATRSMREPGRCPLCDTADAPIVWQEGDYRARQCTCGVLYVDPRPGPADVDATRDLHCDGSYRFGTPARFAFLRRFASHGRLLEVGFGRGHMLERACRAGFQVHGVEPNHAAVEAARARGFVVEHATIEASALPERAFDVVFNVDLLNHFPDPIAALDAMRRRLRPGGVLILEVGVIGAVHPRWYRWWGTLYLPAHRNMFSEEAIHEVLRRAGLEPIAVQRFSLFGSLLLWRATRLLEGRGGGLRPQDASGLPALTKGIFALGERLMNFTRYTLGRVLPKTTALGQLTIFIAARERGHAPAH